MFCTNNFHGQIISLSLLTNKVTEWCRFNWKLHLICFIDTGNVMFQKESIFWFVIKRFIGEMSFMEKYAFIAEQKTIEVPNLTSILQKTFHRRNPLITHMDSVFISLIINQVSTLYSNFRIFCNTFCKTSASLTRKLVYYPGYSFN